ncbi:Plant basic secretory protein family protein, partial [Prunus dulcis]
TALHGNHAVDYVVTNKAGVSPGGVRFDTDIGAKYSRQTLISATGFIWRVFQQNTGADRKSVQKVTLIIDNITGVAYASNNEIHVSAGYIAGYSGDVKREISGVLYHESTHVWQWNGNGQAPGGLIEGIADYVRLKAGQGNRWDQGYDVTARFLDYLNGRRSGFVAELNKKLRSGYSAKYFVDLLGKNVDQLWSDYKAKFLDYLNGLRNGFVAELNKELRSGYSPNYFVDLLGKNVDQLWTEYKAKYGN